MKSVKIVCNKTKPPLGGLITAEYLKTSQNHKIEVVWGSQTTIEIDTTTIDCSTSNDLCRALARLLAENELYGSSVLEKTEVDHWLSYAIGPLTNKYEFPKAIQHLNKALGPITYLVAKKLTIADFAVFSALYVSKEWNALVSKNETPDHIQRWYNLIASHKSVIAVLSNMSEEIKAALTPVASNSRQSLDRSMKANLDKSVTGQRNQEGKFVDLPGAEMGKVIVRFPPEASGYLHIGHAKAALLNQYYQQAFQGKLIMRFDDTNPAKENVHFEQVILEDLEMLEIKPDLFTHTSNYFDLMIEYCERLLKEGKAYVDNTEPELMKLQREQKIECANRSNSVEQNFKMWEEMKKGTQIGQKCCVRAKIDMQSPNGCMRDPTIYRCKNEIHPRTGDKYKVYPTYDFACPIVDAIEDVTHTLRTMEYHDRDAQFYWFIEALGLRRPVIWEYSRLSMTNTVLSKRKLTWFVQEGLVDGWDDPRFPTVRGVLRRGMTVEGLKQFIIAQGSSRSVVFMEWDKIWAFNKKVIDPIAPRYTAVESESPIPVLVKGVKLEKLMVPKHPKNSEIGDKEVWVGPRILIDYVDAEQLKENENATFINWGNLLIKKINRENGAIVSVEAEPNLDNKDYKKTLKLTWLCDTTEAPFTPCYCVYFDHIINKGVLAKDEDFKNYIGHNTRTEVKMLGDPELRKLKKGDIIQLQRRGFFKVDVSYEPANDTCLKTRPIILFSIPDGHKDSATLTTSKPSAKTKKVSDLVPELVKLETKLRASSNPAETKETEKLITNLKAEFKKVSGLDWTDKRLLLQVDTSKTQSNTSCNEITLLSSITQDKIAAEKDAGIKSILTQLLQIKNASGLSAPEIPNSPALNQSVGDFSLNASVNASAVSAEDVVLDKIAAQGEKVRDLKTKKADKATIDAEVKVLLNLKAEYKSITGKDWKPGTVAQKPAPVQPVGLTPTAGGEQEILDKITAQGEKVRDLKTKKADKASVDAEVKVLLSLKAEYKTLTGKDWKPGTVAEKSTAPSLPQTASASAGGEQEILDKIAAQGEKVRDLKSKKADKASVDAEVKVLLSLKADYKSLTGKDWKPGTVAQQSQPQVQAQAQIQTPSASSNNEQVILDKIAAQGDKVRILKTQKADKASVDAEVKTLLALKAEYKSITGKDWKPGTVAATISSPLVVPQSSSQNSEVDISNKITQQGDKVRDLKGKKADKAAIDAEVKVLLALKADYKNLTGKDWKPGQTQVQVQVCPASPMAADSNASGDSAKDALTAKITEQGNVVRNLKTSGGAKADIDAAVKLLLDLKAEYKTLTGTDFPVAGRTPSKPKEPKAPKDPKTPKEAKPAANKKAPTKEKKPVDVQDVDGPKKQTRLGLEATKEENLPDWYSQVITKGEMIEYYDVSGCYIYRPWSYAIWELIKDWFDGEIKKLGVQNCYFPIFVSRSVLEKEKTHIADFAPEVAWVTKSGDSEMAEPIAVRPTSETVMYPAYAKWIQSYRDLPIKLNQWNNVVRWEFKHPQPFLRTREFLWQEGHTAYATSEEACTEVSTILDLYARIYTDLLAIPVIKGRKTEKEKFAGGDYTLTVEAYVSASGRAIQGATSHHLGQNFSKMFDITFEDPDTQEKKFVWQNSWGVTTRTIGVMIMIHADNQGLVLPPQVASIQIVIVPCGITVSLSEEDKTALQNTCDSLESDLKNAGVRVKGDYRNNYSPGWKFNHWELKGVPIRVELGPKDMKNNQLVAVRRDTGEKITIKRANAVTELSALLKTIQQNLYDKASADLNQHKILLNDWAQFTQNLDNKNIILAPFCGDIACEDKIKADSARDDAEAEAGAPAMGAKSLCIPLEQPAEIKSTDKCIHPSCKNKPKFYTLFGRSY